MHSLIEIIDPMGQLFVNDCDSLFDGIDSVLETLSDDIEVSSRFDLVVPKRFE